MGKPQTPSQTQIAELGAAARLKREAIGQITSTVDGLKLTIRLSSHSVCLLEFLSQ
jgi:hypothetical protein